MRLCFAYRIKWKDMGKIGDQCLADQLSSFDHTSWPFFKTAMKAGTEIKSENGF
jgi:hypothetical protein